MVKCNLKSRTMTCIKINETIENNLTFCYDYRDKCTCIRLVNCIFYS